MIKNPHGSGFLITPLTSPPAVAGCAYPRVGTGDRGMLFLFASEVEGLAPI